MPITVATFNTRGDPTVVARRAAFDAVLVANDFVLVQEAGALAALATYTPAAGGAAYNVHGAPQAGALNNRCGTAILTRRAVSWFQSTALRNSNGRFGLYVLDTASNTVIGTMHANAAQNAAADRTGFLVDLAADPQVGARAVVVGADYNIIPPAPVGTRINVGTALRPAHWDVRHPCASTHFGPNGNSELDYFVTRGVPIPAAGNMGQIRVPAGAAGAVGSDHKWVQLTF